MSLGKRIGGSGDITPLIKFDARSGVLYRCDRTRAADGEWYTSQENATGNFVAVFDMENVQVGWIAFSSGGPVVGETQRGEGEQDPDGDELRADLRDHRLGGAAGRVDDAAGGRSGGCRTPVR